MGGVRWNTLAQWVGIVAIAGAVLFAPGTVARADSGTVAWLAPTPTPGSVVNASAGTRLRVELGATSAMTTAVVHIAPIGKLPAGARLSSTDGNPARAVLTWRPAGRQIGSHTIRFKAVDNSPARQLAPPLSLVTRVRAGVVQLSAGNVSHWAFLMRKAVVRAAPSINSYAKTRLSIWTPEYYPNLALALQERIDRDGTWVQIRLPILPNGSTGWVKRAVLGGLHIMHDHLYVYRASTRAVLTRNGVPIFTTRVGVGKSFWPTPAGEFYIREEMTGFHAAAYGPVAFGTSARSGVLTDWPGGGYIGIHGTNAPGLIPGHISHGCIRLRNAAILRLARLIGVGTPLTIR